jgi:hypothetical protein
MSKEIIVLNNYAKGYEILYKLISKYTDKNVENIIDSIYDTLIDVLIKMNIVDINILVNRVMNQSLVDSQIINHMSDEDMEYVYMAIYDIGVNIISQLYTLDKSRPYCIEKIDPYRIILARFY